MKRKIHANALGDYAKDARLFQKVETVPGEQALYETAKNEIRVELSRLSRPATLIDFCCGTCEIFARMLPEPRVARFIGVDNEPSYIEYAKNRLVGVAGVNLVLADAVDCNLNDSGDILIASSAYHHVEDRRKMPFLRNMMRHMKPDGRLVFAENILPGYRDDAEHARSAKLFYGKRIEEARQLGMDEDVISLLHQVMEYEVSRQYEWKVDLPHFVRDLDTAGLQILRKTRVWPTNFEFEDSLAGDYVVVAKIVSSSS